MIINCECGKILARYKDDKLYLFCKRCKKEIPIDINKIVEPKSRDKKS